MNKLPQMSQQIIGEVFSERLYGADDDDLVEGSDDVGRHCAAPCHHVLNVLHHQNIHIGFSPKRNNPSSWFYKIQRGYASLNSLTCAVLQSFASTQQGPSRQMINVARRYQEATQMLTSATEEHGRTFYNSDIKGLNAELMAMRSLGETSFNEADDTPINFY
jgi:hypothetical protein